MKKIAIIGRKKDTANYVNALLTIGAVPMVTLDIGDTANCDGLLLPGGGDITPAFFGQKNTASRNIDTELDILQLQALESAKLHQLPVLGICKGMQLINVFFGGTILQHLPTANLHCYVGNDQYHQTILAKDTPLYTLYGPNAIVNSAHHQSVGSIGKALFPIQWHPDDYCVEAIIHSSLPILGVQWHPERMDPEKSTSSGLQLLRYFFQ